MTYTMIQGNQAHASGPNGPITRIVLHATVSGCHRGGAREVAAYFRSPNSGGLAHFVVDPGEIIQCCAEDVACWHAPPNHGSIGVELCDPQTGTAARWGDPDHKAMLKLAAQLVADLCHRHGVPVAYVDAAGLSAGKHGITKHIDVSHAFRQSDHSDPDAAGAFPMPLFIDLVRAASAPAKPAVGPAVKPTPALAKPTPVQEDDMPVIAKGSGDAQYVTDYATKWHIPSAPLMAELEKQGLKHVTLSDALLAAIPEVKA